MNKKNVAVALLTLFCFAAACSEKSNNSSNQSTSAQINATRQRIDNLKTDANQRANSIDSLASQNANNVNTY